MAVCWHSLLLSAWCQAFLHLLAPLFAQSGAKNVRNHCHKRFSVIRYCFYVFSSRWRWTTTLLRTWPSMYSTSASLCTAPVRCLTGLTTTPTSTGLCQYQTYFNRNVKCKLRLFQGCCFFLFCLLFLGHSNVFKNHTAHSLSIFIFISMTWGSASILNVFFPPWLNILDCI